ncbi:hypothetical protein JMA_15920 [Jeotgalibacillus malaysiensis]|uniref:PASTA domain-containing protein n=1 Tax=Jeotgalibacillus malaysiensis TaxID=1508404 RepID=A0A0B5ASC1_9BACL|nr:PASTA domain-containing protein [Jeotgalibacillus malaysiensis]AJD90909.1 hypothetical protein JMA_15920 [Jeotgalibacillus malaysiensis]
MQHFSERLLKKRLMIVFFLFLLILFVVLVRLFYVQVIAHEQLYEKAIPVSDLLEMHLNLKLDIKGEGEKIIRQSPEPGAVILEGETVRIFIGQ